MVVVADGRIPCLVGRLVGSLAGWLAGWLAGSTSSWLVDTLRMSEVFGRQEVKMKTFRFRPDNSCRWPHQVMVLFLGTQTVAVIPRAAAPGCAGYCLPSP
ncbi:hypothetical protein GGR56DRAFT_638341 [Xylariaceae sp. FL0804]|nr:hypothetical protein GGR56DRAFT_638341 [Xylariaceae sp. FL0804]